MEKSKLSEILDFEVCKQLIAKGIENDDYCAILAPLYSINIAAKYEDSEELQWDLEELEKFIGYSGRVNDYDDLIVVLKPDE